VKFVDFGFTVACSGKEIDSKKILFARLKSNLYLFFFIQEEDILFLQATKQGDILKNQLQQREKWIEEQLASYKKQIIALREQVLTHIP
jgi:hypothetical protein